MFSSVAVVVLVVIVAVTGDWDPPVGCAFLVCLVVVVITVGRVVRIVRAPPASRYCCRILSLWPLLGFVCTLLDCLWCN